MAEEIAVRDEKSSLKTVSETLKAIESSKDTEELAYLLLLVTEAYGDASCRCEELGAAYGPEEEKVIACKRNVSTSRDDILETYKNIIEKLKEK